jgi:hypothetical protein
MYELRSVVILPSIQKRIMYMWFAFGLLYSINSWTCFLRFLASVTSWPSHILRRYTVTLLIGCQVLAGLVFDFPVIISIGMVQSKPQLIAVESSWARSLRHWRNDVLPSTSMSPDRTGCPISACLDSTPGNRRNIRVTWNLNLSPFKKHQYGCFVVFQGSFAPFILQKRLLSPQASNCSQG